LCVLSRTNLAHCSHNSSRNPRPFNLLQPLASPFATPVLCFQPLAASFPKTPGWGVHSLCGNPCLPSLPRASGTSQGSHLARGCKYAEPATVTTFKINTCKSVSKQRTLTLSRINTYKKKGEGGTRFPFQLPAKRTGSKETQLVADLEGHVSWPALTLMLHFGHLQRRKFGCLGCTSSKYIGWPSREQY
jgi:hypothetical protein